MIQRSEDPARNLRAVWLGPDGAWRWPFDATFTEWSIGLIVFVLSFVVLWLVLPLGVLMVLAALAFGRWAAWTVSDGQLTVLTRSEGSTGRTRARRGLAAVVLILELLVLPSPRSWLLPMWWWLALPGAVYVAFRIVKMARPHFDGNRSPAYWLKTLRAVAAGPRPTRTPLTIIPIVDLPQDAPPVVKVRPVTAPQPPRADRTRPSAPARTVRTAPRKPQEPRVRAPEPAQAPRRPSRLLWTRDAILFGVVTVQDDSGRHYIPTNRYHEEVHDVRS